MTFYQTVQKLVQTNCSNPTIDTQLKLPARFLLKGFSKILSKWKNVHNFAAWCIVDLYWHHFREGI